METAIFVENLNYVFKNLGITKAHVAKICGVSKATVSMWLSGRKPYRQSIETIADLFSDLLHLSITADQLLARGPARAAAQERGEAGGHQETGARAGCHAHRGPGAHHGTGQPAEREGQSRVLHLTPGCPPVRREHQSEAPPSP
jgi:transcriptional regulator with XRE-family HTH domain